MNERFARLMRAATQSTVEGDLGAATRMIQDALAGQAVMPDSGRTANPATVDPDSTVIDVSFREVVDVETDVCAEPEVVTPVRADVRLVRSAHQTPAGARQYRLLVPSSTHDRKRPMIVMLHGCTQNSDDFALGTGMDEFARQEGLILLYPEQSRQANLNGCWNWFEVSHQRRDHGECAILADMVQAVSTQHGADPGRIYVAGMSAGGAMAATLSAEYPDLFRALGVHSGLPAGQASDMPSAMQLMSRRTSRPGRAAAGPCAPTIVFHGTADRTVNPVNGKEVFDAAVARSASQSLHTENGTTTGRRYTRTICLAETGQPLHEHWAVQGAGHAWSGGKPGGSYVDQAGPDASAEMVRFFLSHK